MTRRPLGASTLALLGLLAGAPASAQTADLKPTTAQSETSDQPSADVGTAPPPSIQSSLGPYGDPGGVRSFLSSKGITYSFTYIGEVLGNGSGGIKRGTIYEGRLAMQLDADLDKLLGWEGATFHTNAYQIHGRGLSRYYLANLLVTSGIEALPSTRLYELWLEQKLLDGKLFVRAGQLAADTEFVVSQTAGLFFNSTFGFPGITAANLPNGGPAYPLATPGIRVKVAPTESLAILIGLFNGDPAGRPNPYYGPTDPQILNPSGTSFRVQDPPLLFAEAAYSYGQEKTPEALPGTLKLGYWHHFGRFDDRRFDTAGLSLADPSTTGIARRLRGNDGVYGIIDQSIYRVPGTDDQGASVFLRVSGSPGDRNAVGFYADAGIAFKGLIPGRPNDTFGVSVAYLKISEVDRRLDLDTIGFTGAPIPRRDAEALIEATYQAEVVPGFTLQPDFQYVFRPGGNVVDTRDPYGRPVKDAAIGGLRATIRY